MLSKVPGKNVTVHIIAARVRMDMKVSKIDAWVVFLANTPWVRLFERYPACAVCMEERLYPTACWAAVHVVNNQSHKSATSYVRSEVYTQASLTHAVLRIISEMEQIAFGEVKDEIRRGIEPKGRSSIAKLASPRAALDRLQKKIASPPHQR